MILPSIDLQNKQAVQLIQGETLAIEAGDPRPIAQQFARVGEIAVVDLDAAFGCGDNRQTILDLLQIAPCRVGGGIRDLETAQFWLNAGATRIVIGTAASPEFLSQLPRERLIAALDARNGEVVIEGWRTKTGVDIATKMEELRPYVSGFLVTFVEREGKLQGTDLDRVARLKEAAGGRELTIAGGITTAEEVAALDQFGVHAQIGMALYSGRMSLSEAYTAPLISDRPDGLWPTIVVNPEGVALGLCYSNAESLAQALDTGRGVYWSRRRGIWEKGATSGNRQQLLRVDMDCDRDTLRFTVRQEGDGFCHLNQPTCFGGNSGLGRLMSRITERKTMAPPDSYTARLFNEPDLLQAKLMEEAEELAQAQSANETLWESADLLYFTLVTAASRGVGLEDIVAELDRRALQVTRRGGDAKPGRRA